MKNLSLAIEFLRSELSRISVVGDNDAARVLSAALGTLEEGVQSAGRVQRFVERRERRQCSLYAKVITSTSSDACRITDISLTGLGLEIKLNDLVERGQDVTIVSDIIGTLSGTIRWIKHPKYGVELVQGSQNCGELKALFDALS